MQSSKNKTLLQILRMLALGCFWTLLWSESPNISQNKQGNGPACAAMWLIRELSFSTLLSSLESVTQAQVDIIPRSLRKGRWAAHPPSPHTSWISRKLAFKDRMQIRVRCKKAFSLWRLPCMQCGFSSWSNGITCMFLSFSFFSYISVQRVGVTELNVKAAPAVCGPPPATIPWP